MPTDTRMRPSKIPMASRSSRDRPTCVVSTGRVTSVSTPPSEGATRASSRPCANSRTWSSSGASHLTAVQSYFCPGGNGRPANMHTCQIKLFGGCNACMTGLWGLQACIIATSPMVGPCESMTGCSPPCCDVSSSNQEAVRDCPDALNPSCVW